MGFKYTDAFSTGSIFAAETQAEPNSLMKKILVLVLVAGHTLNVLAQSPVIVTDHDGNVVNGTSVLGWGPPAPLRSRSAEDRIR
jgi:hypothetical protein